MEKQFIGRQGNEAYGTANHNLSKEIQDRALNPQIMQGDFPVAAAALMVRYSPVLNRKLTLLICN
jgi:hypothetical protein